MKSFSLALLLSLAASTAHAEVVFNQANETITHDCGTDPDVSISGSSSTLTLTGMCARVAIQGSANHISIASVDKVAIAGSSNEVQIDAANKIAIVGTGNQVTWKKAIKGKKPKISSMGAQNRVSKVK